MGTTVALLPQVIAIADGSLNRRNLKVHVGTIVSSSIEYAGIGREDGLP